MSESHKEPAREGKTASSFPMSLVTPDPSMSSLVPKPNHQLLTEEKAAFTS